MSCYNCENLKLCKKNNWVITFDKDGKTCDKYKPIRLKEYNKRSDLIDYKVTIF